MAWNEPGGNNNKDPWGRETQSPPDLDDVLNKLLAGFKGFGSKKSSPSGGNSGRGLLAQVSSCR